MLITDASFSFCGLNNKTCAKTDNVRGYTWRGQPCGTSVFHGETPKWFSKQAWRLFKLLFVIRLWVNRVKAPEKSQYSWPNAAPKYTEIVPEKKKYYDSLQTNLLSIDK